MRTTLNLDDDVIDAARSLANSEHRSLGQVISDLVRSGLAPRELPDAASANGFPVFRVDPSAPAITDEMVFNALDKP